LQVGANVYAGTPKPTKNNSIVSTQVLVAKPVVTTPNGLNN